eukprot:2282681-Lingulodinium_polyedra.AAC.1
METYHVWSTPHRDRLYRQDVANFPFVLIRCTHGHGEAMRPILDNLQVPASIPVLKRGAGLFPRNEADVSHSDSARRHFADGESCID